MHQAPEPPGQRAGQLDPAEIGNRRLAADGRQASGMAVPKRVGRPASGQPGLDHLGGVLAALLGSRRQPRHRLALPAFAQRRIADDEDLRLARHGQVGADLNAAGPVVIGRQPFGGRRCEDARRPEHRARRHPVAADLHPGRVDVLDPRPGSDLDAQVAQRPLGLRRQPLGERRQQPGRRLDQQHPRVGRIDVAELPLHPLPRQFGDGAGQLDTGRPAADDDERHVLFLEIRIVGVLGALESDQQPAADRRRILDLLEAGGQILPLVAAEIAVPRAGGENQVVVGYPRVFHDHRLVRGVDVGDPAEQDPHIGLAAEDLADGRGDVRRRQRRGRHLVEQRLEQMVVVPVDQRHPARGIAEGARRRDAGEPGPHDDHVGQVAEVRPGQVGVAGIGRAQARPDPMVDRYRPRPAQQDQPQQQQPVQMVDVVAEGELEGQRQDDQRQGRQARPDADDQQDGENQFDECREVGDQRRGLVFLLEAEHRDIQIADLDQTGDEEDRRDPVADEQHVDRADIGLDQAEQDGQRPRQGQRRRRQPASDQAVERDRPGPHGDVPAEQNDVEQLAADLRIVQMRQPRQRQHGDRGKPRGQAEDEEDRPQDLDGHAEIGGRCRVEPGHRVLEFGQVQRRRPVVQLGQAGRPQALRQP